MSRAKNSQSLKTSRYQDAFGASIAYRRYDGPSIITKSFVGPHARDLDRSNEGVEVLHIWADMRYAGTVCEDIPQELDDTPDPVHGVFGRWWVDVRLHFVLTRKPGTMSWTPAQAVAERMVPRQTAEWAGTSELRRDSARRALKAFHRELGGYAETMLAQLAGNTDEVLAAIRRVGFPSGADFLTSQWQAHLPIHSTQYHPRVYDGSGRIPAMDMAAPRRSARKPRDLWAAVHAFLDGRAELTGICPFLFYDSARVIAKLAQPGSIAVVTNARKAFRNYRLAKAHGSVPSTPDTDLERDQYRQQCRDAVRAVVVAAPNILTAEDIAILGRDLRSIGAVVLVEAAADVSRFDTPTNTPLLNESADRVIAALELRLGLGN